jgi:hypothetical protein
MKFNLRGAIRGFGEATENVGLAMMKSAILAARDEKMAMFKAQHDEKMAGMKHANDLALVDRKYELENQGRKAIGDAVSVARETLVNDEDAEGNIIERQRTPRELYVVAEGAALEQGDHTAAKAFHDLGKRNLTKVGQDETVLDESGRPVFVNDAGQRRRTDEALLKHQLKLDELTNEYGLKRQVEDYKRTHGENSATALMRNVQYLVSQRIAKDPAEAFEKLKTSNERAEGDAVMGVAGMLSRSPEYRGQGGMQKAARDARDIVRELRGIESATGSSQSAARQMLYKSPQAVQQAYRQGRLSRDAALRELRENFGME